MNDLRYVYVWVHGCVRNTHPREATRFSHFFGVLKYKSGDWPDLLYMSNA